MLVVLPALVSIVIIQGSDSNLFAEEIPMSLSIGLTLSVDQNLSAPPEKGDKTASAVEYSQYAFSVEISDENFRYVETTNEYYLNAYNLEPMPADRSFPFDDALEQWESMASTESLTIDSAAVGDEAPAQDAPRVDPSEPEDPFIPIIMKAASVHKVDPAIIKAIIKAESGYNPKAVSKAGAKGLMQLMPRTAKSLGVKDIFSPEQNILAGVKYFKQLLNQFEGDIKLALAAYNAGSRKVRKYRGIPPFRTTRIYIKKVFKYHKEYTQKAVENG